MWPDYIQKTKDKATSKYLIEAVSFISQPGDALDLGSGSGVESRYLVKQGFKVQAVDAESVAQAALADLIEQSKVNFILSKFETFSFNHYQLINASYALPFIGAQNFPAFWH